MHGSNCRNSYEDHHRVLLSHPLSLERLELEIVQLLKAQRGHPISIASLPMMYFERYGRTLQAEGYLTESQRHGKAGYNLTRILAQLKNIRLIDRPHGQHAVMLAEDALKYMEIQGDRYDSYNLIVSGTRQIYMTFPAESIFNEQDVSNYFSAFGPVQDVRIPFQQKRMFGFVTFVSAYTVKLILSQGNPHYVCGARVLVKPYREKSKLAERYAF
ncbi:zinc finger CCCH domain-containing protein 18 [Phtheirospermum japonicum]|uniref:Zinc finger CCCH domain-containing protein 18 n=1 Tax=Phtheirospermum japonicum TaxID=374723 RepID=A0A830BEU5_9LAMI|nr:zinc finger CCCH domain-containing protein 18 [Phtheirospermum japonicum]